MTFYEELQNSDWLGRNPEEYTYKKTGLSIGWEESLTKGDALSKFIMRVSSTNLTNPKKIMLTKQACTNILSRMTTNRKVRIVFTNEFQSYQKGELVCVTLEPLGERVKFPSFNHSLDPILGFCVHEIAHHLFTDIEYDNYLNRFKGQEQETKQMIMNVLEDERIEHKVAGIFRGYTGYLGKAKDYAFGKRLDEEMIKAKVNIKEEIIQLISCFHGLLRYPRGLNPDYVNKFEKELREIMAILTPYPENCIELSEATEKIYAVFMRFYTAPKSKPQPPQKQQGGGDGDGDDDSADDGEAGAKGKSKKGKNGKPKKDKSDENDTDNSPDSGDDDEEKGGGSDEQEESDGEEKDGKKKDGKKKPKPKKSDDSDEEGDAESDGQGNGDKEEDGDDAGDGKKGDGDGDEDDEQGDGSGEGGSVEEMLEVLGAFLIAIANAEPMTGTANEVARVISKGDYSVPKALQSISAYDNNEIADRTSSAHVYPETANLGIGELSVKWNEAKDLAPSTNHYDRALSEVRIFASSLRAKIQQLNRNHSITNQGLYEGNFDEDNLVNAIIGAKNVYKEDSRILNRGACIGLLIDESGSMREHGNWFSAQKIAVLFERALEGCNGVDFYCYGHTTGSAENFGGMPDATWINVYYEGRKNSDRKILGKIAHHSTNRDGHAILEVVARMRTKVPKDLPIILFMISDGEPSASVPDGYNGRTYTKKAVDTVEKFSNATVIHIAIEKGIPSNQMFNHFIEFTDHNTLVTDVGALLKRIILKQQMPIEIM